MRTNYDKHFLKALASGFGAIIAGCGTVGSPCGPSVGTPCAAGLYCQMDTGKCDDATAIGVCTEIPQVCPQIYSPVCGCDDKTYSSACDAAAAGVNVQHDGACVSGLYVHCGPPDETLCSEGLFCNFGDGMCGTSDRSGQCMPIPTECPTDVNIAGGPVCGCDDLTYDNECLARMASVSIKGYEACPEGGGLNVRCGGADALTCTDGFFCMYATGICSSTTESGQCQQIPEVCTADVSPVCGCDGITYSNACEAMRASVNVMSDGACP